MNLVIDIGNSLTKAAIFKNGRIGAMEVWNEIDRGAIEKMIGKHEVQRTILCSVRPVNDELRKWLRSVGKKTFAFEDQTSVPLKNTYETQSTLGKDRVAAVVGAITRFPGQRLLIIDAGTCITYDFVDEKAVYHGGSISPGVRLRLRAMHQFTGKLPSLDFSPDFTLVGKSTRQAMLSGVTNGIAFEIEGFIAAYKKKHPEMKALMTGGDLQYFESRVKSEIFAVPNLVLTGLNKILEYNVE